MMLSREHMRGRLIHAGEPPERARDASVIQPKPAFSGVMTLGRIAYVFWHIYILLKKVQATKIADVNYGDCSHHSMLQNYWEAQMTKYLLAVLLMAAPFFMNAANAGGCATNSYGQVVCAPPGGGAAVNGYGQVITGRGGCATNSYGQVVCGDTSGGGAAVNSYGQVKTGAGECVTNSYGQVMCSSQPGGGAAINSYGQAVCQGGCVPGDSR